MTTFNELLLDKLNTNAEAILNTVLSGTGATIEQRFLHLTVQHLLLDGDLRETAKIVAKYLSGGYTLGIHAATKPLLKSSGLVSNKLYGIGYPHVDGTNHYFPVVRPEPFDMASLIGDYEGPHGTRVFVHSTLDYNAYRINGVMESFLSSYKYLDKYGTGNMDTYIGEEIHLYPVPKNIIKEAQAAGIVLVGVYTPTQHPNKDTPAYAAMGFMADLDRDKINTLTSIIGEDIEEALQQRNNVWCAVVPKK